MHDWNRPKIFAAAMVTALTALMVSAAEKAEDLASQAAQAFSAGKSDEALKLAGQSIDADPNNPRWRQLRARLYAAVGKHEQAIADWNQVIKLRPDGAEAYDERGSQHFMLGHIGESIVDFDKFIALRPDQEVSHWKRGISYYYAGRYEDGRKQFEGYQTFDDNDVENAVWRYLCMARSVGTQKAGESMLKIKTDTRVPMMQVYALYSGQAKPEDVLAAANAGNPSPDALNARLFYAHLYLGLYFETEKDSVRALEHLAEAEKHKIGHYMWDVARVHAELLRKKDAGKT